MGIVYIDRGEKNHRRKYPYRLFLKTLFYANLSEDKESYPTEARKQQVNKYALGGLKKQKQIKRGQRELPSCDEGLL